MPHHKNNECHQQCHWNDLCYYVPHDKKQLMSPTMSLEWPYTTYE